MYDAMIMQPGGHADERAHESTRQARTGPIPEQGQLVVMCV
jgi:hypothetical protein